jgi:hypothetical protein
MSISMSIHLRLFTMEHLFSPCTRYRDIAESEGRLEEFEDFPEELALDVSTEELLSAERAFTFADLYAILGNGEDMVAWLTAHASVMCSIGRVENYCNFLVGDVYLIRFNIDGKRVDIFARSSEALSEICDIVFRLLAASVVHSVILDKLRFPDGAWIDSPTSLTYLMEQCQSLKALTLAQIILDENHCRVLGALSRPGLEITLDNCVITGAAATVLAQVLGQNKGLTKLDCCTIDNSILADGLRGNSHLKSLILRLSNNLEVDREVLAIAGALKENKGLVDLNLRYVISAVSDETWDAVCDSLKTHPTLKLLNLWRANGAPSDPARLKSRMQALVDMMQVNVLIDTIRLSHCYSGHELMRESVIPYLETNRLRPRVRDIQKTRPMAYRAKVLGRALLAARTDVNSFWMLLSGNPEVAFP